MPVKTPKALKGEQGKMEGYYRDVNGKSISARVQAAGSVSGVKINTRSPQQSLDNIAIATGLKQTGVFFWRSQ